ncbi:hypothetical protein [Leuconostoc suionicum]|uniref:hypothetical protein n=1 Tax=Leuconostoc suionicum TaxID=1511761 RepID=UPI0032DF1D1B
MKVKLKNSLFYVFERSSVIGLDILMIVLMSQYFSQLASGQIGQSLKLLLITVVVHLNIFALVIRDAEDFNDKVSALNFLLVMIITLKYTL